MIPLLPRYLILVSWIIVGADPKFVLPTLGAIGTLAILVLISRRSPNKRSVAFRRHKAGQEFFVITKSQLSTNSAS